MIQSSKTIRLFVSSTFSDFVDERNALQNIVFPHLAQLCRKMGARFQAVDLRWGVSNEAGINQQTINICLDEIARCQRISPRPNFLVLLGDRYGWQPVPAAIKAKEFESILMHLIKINRNDDSKILNHWYALDENAVPPVYCLKPRKGKYINYDAWNSVEHKLVTILRGAADAIELSKEAREKYFLSATGQEIVLGALNPPERVPDPNKHVFCFFRAIKNLPIDEQPFAVKDYVDLNAVGYPEPEAQKHLQELKKRLEQKLKGNIYYYNTWWSVESGIYKGYIEQLCKDVETKLLKVITSQLAKIKKKSDTEREVEAHAAFKAERVSTFEGREVIINEVKSYLTNQNKQPLAIYGLGGSGKSSVIAKIVDEAQSLLPEANIIYRFIGVTPSSINAYSLIDSICRQIASEYQGGTYKTPATFNELTEVFYKLLALATAQKPLVLIIDALDQLSTTDNAKNLGWLPKNLPHNVKIVVSTIHGECYRALQAKLKRPSLVKLKPMSPGESEILFQSWLGKAQRSLQPIQWMEVISRFEKMGLPLYLRLVFEETRQWKSTELKKLSPSINGMIRRLFNRLSRNANHGPVMVAKSLGYLAAARIGLSEDELLDVLSADQEILQDYRQRSPNSPREDRLPFIVWSRLFFDLEPYLTVRDAGGTEVFNFFHRQFGAVVKKVYLSKHIKESYHRHLARYFHTQELYLDDQQEIPNYRKLMELPFQLTQGGLLENLAQVLSDTDFIKAKVDLGYATELLDEMDTAYQRLSNKKLENSSGPQLSSQLPRALFKYFISLRGIENPTLSLEDIHACLIYRKNTSFYKAFLKKGTSKASIKGCGPGFSEFIIEEIYLTFSSRIANMQRRAGNLEQAEQVYSTILPSLMAKEPLLKELARVQYDIGYVKYLRGKFEDAVNYLAMSAQSAERTGDEVGKWISICVMYYVKVVSMMGSTKLDEVLDDFLNVLNDAYKVFTINQTTNTTAERWIMNIHNHRFKAAYYKKDRRNTRLALIELERDPWVARNDNKSFLLPYRARMAILSRNYTAAIQYFKDYLNPMEKDRQKLFKAESVTENYLDCGIAFLKGGYEEESVKCWQTGMSCPDEPGNHKWKEIILFHLKKQGFSQN